MRTLKRIALVSLFVIVATMSMQRSVMASPMSEFDMATAELRQGGLEEAVRLLDSFIVKNPKSYAAHVNRGSALFYLGYVYRGVLDWHKARDLAPLFAFGVFTGEIVWQSEPRGPYLDFVASIELYPDHVATVGMIGATYLDLGLTEKALNFYRKSADLTSNPLFKADLEWWSYTLKPSTKHRKRNQQVQQ